MSDTDRILCADAQTSGGLLLAVAEDDAGELQRAAQGWRARSEQAIVGRCLAGTPGGIRVLVN